MRTTAAWVVLASLGCVTWYHYAVPTPRYNIDTTPTQDPRRVLMVLPNYGFDPSEAAVPWEALVDKGHRVIFATEDGKESAADSLVLSGYMGGLLGIHPGPLKAYKKMIQQPEFQDPLSWTQVKASDYDAIIFPGGHDKAMISYLTSPVVQGLARELWELGRPVAAVCHGTLVLARATHSKTGKSLLHQRRTTVVPAWMERLAYITTWPVYGRYHLDTTWPIYTEDLVRATGAQVDIGGYRLSDVFLHGTATSHKGTHVVEDGNYISARFPGDVYALGQRFATMVGQAPRGQGRGPQGQ